ncbi:MAG: 4-hydroxy-3-methylbut-2-enyl diphosphate reductase [Patescibacteria group bacterium]|jgi:(E)-4-hydroxy-3-methyl-but-2-enyl pyrophosphate reductase|nr:4-hydroxy-3-methylbut-2-enyl diphosphate reductase [Patescibacteria group bacterium]
MKITVAKKSGFCFGVNRAVEMARKGLGKNAKPVFSLGPIIHNPDFIAELEREGMKVIESIDEVNMDDGYFIIRSHGTTSEIIESAKRKGLEIINTTCPFVKKAQEVAREFFEKDFEVVIFGDKEHAEVVGINGYAKNQSKIVFTEKDLEKIDFSRPIGVLSQTTQKNENFNKIVSLIKLRAEKEVIIENTICLDSTNKKEEISELARKNDLVIVIGGKNSNNTKKLAEVGKNSNENTYHIENPEELQRDWFMGRESVLIGAGASTPRKHIEEVVKTIGQMLEI